MAYDLNDVLRNEPPGSVRRIIDEAKPFKPDRQQFNGVPESGGDWPEPEPMLDLTEPLDYPIGSLPSGLAEAVREVVEAAQCPPALAASSALSMLSLAAQGTAKVERPSGHVGPVSLFMMQVAESGERKSTVDNYFSTGIREYERERAELLAPEVRDHKAAFASWEGRKTGLKRAIEAAAKKGQSTDDFEKTLRDAEALEPLPPRIPRLLHSDATTEGLAWDLHFKWPSAGIMSPEGGVVFGGHAMQPEKIMGNLALLNTLWDGGAHSVTRKGSESFTLEGACLSIGIAVQPQTVRQFHEKTKGLSRGTGFAARFLISWPQSTIGGRTFKQVKPMPHLAAFHARLKVLLNQAPQPEIKSGRIAFHTIRFLPSSASSWIEYYNDTEQRQAPGGDLEYFRDIGSKTAEIAGRVAALFHIYEKGPEGSISEGHARAATRIAAWHLIEAKRFLNEVAAPVAENQDRELDGWLRRKCIGDGTNRIITRDILRLGPPFARKAEDRDAIVNRLEKRSRVRRVKHNGESFIEVNPRVLSDVR